MKTKIHYAPQYFMEPTHPITVTVVGVGGNGTQVLNDLAKIHCSLIELGHPGLFVQAIDDDKVDDPNVGRQKFSPQDVGNYKASVMITRLNRFYGTNWTAICERFDDSWKGTNIIISAVDNVETRMQINERFNQARRESNDYTAQWYWLDFGNAKDFGQFVLGSHIILQPESKYETESCLKNVLQLFPNMEENEEISGPSCSTREALLKQDLFINSVLVSTGMNLIWDLLTKYVISHQGGFVNLKTCNTKPIKL
jgi:PRTRC genetic system ThiF family protein